MDTPTAEAVRTWIPNATWTDWGYASGQDPDSITRIAAAASQQTLDVTGWGTWAAVPPEKEPLLEHAVGIMTAMFAAQSSPEYLETLSDFDLIQSFSAGSYSETRRSPDEAIKAKMLAPWPMAHAALLAAMTPEKMEAYLAYLNGQNVPSFEVTEVDWTGWGMSADLADLWGWSDPMNPWSPLW